MDLSPESRQEYVIRAVVAFVLIIALLVVFFLLKTGRLALPTLVE
jgi:hypothetical protein